jgi:hypothetical protein
VEVEGKGEITVPVQDVVGIVKIGTTGELIEIVVVVPTAH